VGESRRERGTGESDGEGDEFDLSPVSLESRDEGGVFLAPGFHFGVAAQIFVEADLDDDEGIEFFIEGRRVWVWGVRNAPGINQVRARSMSGGVKLLDIISRYNPIRYAAGAAVYCEYPSTTERLLVSYRGSLDTSVRQILRTLLGLGIGSSQSGWGVFTPGEGSSPSSEVDDPR